MCLLLQSGKLLEGREVGGSIIAAWLHVLCDQVTSQKHTVGSVTLDMKDHWKNRLRTLGSFCQTNPFESAEI